MPGENLLQTVQRIATSIQRLDALIEEHKLFEARITARMERLEEQVTHLRERLETQATDIRERLARLEASREADRAQAQADLARFMAEVERAETRLSRMLRTQPRQLPQSGEEST